VFDQFVTVGQHDGLLDGGADPPGGGDGHVHSGHVFQQHHEFVPTESGQQIVTAHPALSRAPIATRNPSPVT